MKRQRVGFPHRVANVALAVLDEIWPMLRQRMHDCGIVWALTGRLQQRDQILELADELLSTDLEPLPVRVCFSSSSPQPEPRMRSGVFARPVNQD